MESIKDIIYQVIEKIAVQRDGSHEKIERVWQSILDPHELEHIKLQGQKEGWLSVLVDSPAWLYQMQLKKYKILKRLQDEIPEITNIRFKIGKIK